jgi:hypothetical protein
VLSLNFVQFIIQVRLNLERPFVWIESRTIMNPFQIFLPPMRYSSNENTQRHFRRAQQKYTVTSEIVDDFRQMNRAEKRQVLRQLIEILVDNDS